MALSVSPLLSLFSFGLRTTLIATKFLAIQDMAELFPNSVPPQKILTERGQELYRWFKIGIGVFIASVFMCIFLYSK